MINEKKKLRLEQEKIIEEQQQQEQQKGVPVSPISKKNSVFIPSNRMPDQVNSIYKQNRSSRNVSTADTNLKQSRWRRFLNFVCCNEKDQSFIDADGNLGSSGKYSQNSKSFKSSLQGDWNGIDPTLRYSEGRFSISSQLGQYNQNRNASNTNLMLYNILHYRANGYSQMHFGHYSFFQIPVRFEQHQYSNKKCFSDIFGRLFQGDLILVDQAYLDWEFIASISKMYSHIICGFSSYLQCLPSSNQMGTNINNNIPGFQYNGTQQKNVSPLATQQSSPSSSSYNLQIFTKIPETVLLKPELQNAEFLYCSDLGFTVNFDLYDRIVLIPASLKCQGNYFDTAFNMRPEFRHKLQQMLHDYIDNLDKVIILLPKYCKIKEVMLIIYDTYYKSNLSLFELNFGIQFHSMADEFGEIDAIALCFDSNQHQETLTALSQRVFSNINPTIPSLALPSPSKKLTENQKQEIGSSKKLDESTNKQKNIDQSQRSTKSTTKKSEDNFVVSEDFFTNKEINTSNTQKTVSEFFGEEYIAQIGQSQFKNLYNFLRELNTQFIIQDNVFYYRTSIIDSMLKNNVIQQEFVETLVNYFAKEDLMKMGNLSLSPKSQNKPEYKFGIKKSKKKDETKKDQNSKIQQNVDFKDFFQKNSKNFTMKFYQQTQEQNNLQQHERIYSPSDYEYQSETTTDQDLHFGANNSHNNHILLQNQNMNQSGSSTSKLQNHLNSNPSDNMIQLPQESKDYFQQNMMDKSSTEQPNNSRQRQKQISCNYYTSPSNNKHIGFKSKKLNKSALDQDILNSTTACKIVIDKKTKKDLLEQSAPDKSQAQKNNNLKGDQDVIPEELYSSRGQMLSRSHKLSQD